MFCNNFAVRGMLGITIALAAMHTLALENIHVNGFGSIAAGYAEETTTFRNADYESLVEFKQNSKFAVQITADLDEGLSATAQVLAEGNKDFEPDFEWSYLSYDISENTTIRAGRLRIPFYYYSDFLDVGYAYTFIRPPQAMYSLQFSTFDGVGVLHTFNISDFEILANINFGNVNDVIFESTFPTDGILENFAGINLQLTKDFFSAYLAYFRAEADIPVAVIEDTADALVAAGATPEQGSLLRINGDAAAFIGGGISIDYENILFMAEYAEIEVEDALDLKSDEWYFMAGYRIDNLTPYVTYEQTDNDRNTSTANKFPGPLQPNVQAAFDSLRFGYKATSLGIRYDFHHSAALKVQYTHYNEIYDTSSGFGTPDDKENLGSVFTSIDFVF